MKEFGDVFSVETQLKVIDCPPMQIELRPGAIPTCISAPRKIGLAIVDKVKAEVEDMEKKDFIEKIPADRPTECPRGKETECRKHRLTLCRMQG